MDSSKPRALSDDVRTLAESIVSEHVDRHVRYAQEVVARNLAKVEAGIGREMRVVNARMPSVKAAGTPDIGFPSPVSRPEVCKACAYVERAAAELARCCTRTRKRLNRSTRRRDVVATVLTPAEPVPRFDAWVPVNKEFWISNEFMVEPYMPWFGDDECERGNAYNVYRKMASASGQEETLVSDGELREDGTFEEPEGEEAWHLYDSAHEQRKRDARRKAVLSACTKYDRKDPGVLDTLVEALGLSSRRHLYKILEIAENRESQAKEAEATRLAALAEEQRTAEAWVTDLGFEDYDDAWYVDEAIAPLSHFCFTCHVFHCRRHEGHNVEPIIPIKDLYVEGRAAAWKKLKPEVIEEDLPPPGFGTGLKPCGDNCFLSPVSRKSPRAPASDEDCVTSWTKEERLILRESISIFKRDYCSLAKMIGPSKTCLETAIYLRQPDVVADTNRILAELNRKRWPLELNRGGRMRGDLAAAGQAKTSGDGDDSDVRKRKAKGRSSGRSVNGAKPVAKTVAGSGAVADDESDGIDPYQEADFTPCAHLGPCDKAACSCFVKNLMCEATCGCNSGRWTSRGYEVPGARNGISDRKKVCMKRHWGCACKPGSNCNTPDCICWNERRSCDPDFCDHCQANILPSQIMSEKRDCRNVGVLTGRHKRTIIGKSSVHGFGLFAGEVFEEGDLVGIYGGGIMDTKAADRIGHLYDAKDHTFFFDVTQSLVVDGGMLGMKSKFVNHVRGNSPLENCISRCVRVRGMVHIALFAKRRVEIGEEFRFDYKFQVVVPAWAQESSDEKAGEGSPEKPKLLSGPREARAGRSVQHALAFDENGSESEDEYDADDDDEDDLEGYGGSEDSYVGGP